MCYLSLVSPSKQWFSNIYHRVDNNIQRNFGWKVQCVLKILISDFLCKSVWMKVQDNQGPMLSLMPQSQGCEHCEGDGRSNSKYIFLRRVAYTSAAWKLWNHELNKSFGFLKNFFIFIHFVLALSLSSTMQTPGTRSMGDQPYPLYHPTSFLVYFFKWWKAELHNQLLFSSLKGLYSHVCIQYVMGKASGSWQTPGSISWFPWGRAVRTGRWHTTTIKNSGRQSLPVKALF